MQKFYLDQQAIHGAANKRMIEAVRANPEVDGYCIHALAAGDWILGAGLIDLWRKPKSYAYEGTKAANQDQILSIRVIPRNIYTENGARIEIIGINDLVDTNAKLVVDVKSESGKTVYSKNENINYKHGPSSLLIDELATKKWKGNYVVNARIVSSLGTEITANDYDFDVFRNKDLKFPKAKIAVLHANEPLAKFLTSKKINVISFNQSLDISIPVFATGTLKKDEEKKGTYQSLIEFAKKGGTVVYIDGASKATTSDQSVFPFSTLVHPGRGLWTCIPH